MSFILCQQIRQFLTKIWRLFLPNTWSLWQVGVSSASPFSTIDICNLCFCKVFLILLFQKWTYLIKRVFTPFNFNMSSEVKKNQGPAVSIKVPDGPALPVVRGGGRGNFGGRGGRNAGSGNERGGGRGGRGGFNNQQGSNRHNSPAPGGQRGNKYTTTRTGFFLQK